MGDLVVNDDHDPAFILLQAFNVRFLETNDIYDAYRHARNSHPVEFQAVSERALEYGHQQGVVGDTYRCRLQMILKGHHRHPQSGISIGRDGFVACVVVKYRSHNFAAIPYIEIGGSGGLIKEAYVVQQRLLRDQEFTAYNIALHMSVNSNLPLRLYARLPDPVTGEFWYRYLGLFRIIGEQVIETDQGHRCFQYRIIRFQVPDGLGFDFPGPDGNDIFLGGPGPVPGIFLGGAAPVEQDNGEVPDLHEIWHVQPEAEGDQVAVVMDDSPKRNFLTWKIHKRKRSEKLYYDFPLKIHRKKRSEKIYCDFISGSEAVGRYMR